MILRQLLKSKIHHARVSYANPDYVGSIEICRDLMNRVGLIDGEHVHIWAVDKDVRIETYCFGGGPGVIGINGGAARLFEPGDRLIIATFALSDDAIEPQIVLCDEQNRPVRNLTPFSVLG